MKDKRWRRFSQAVGKVPKQFYGEEERDDAYAEKTLCYLSAAVGFRRS
jgi:hypothetical protein